MSSNKASGSDSRRNSGGSGKLSAFGSTTSLTKALNQQGYHIGSKIGKGSFSSVRVAKWVSKNQNVVTLACKVINVQKGTDEFVKKFFPRELNVLMKIRHPHIIRIHSILKRDMMVFIFMEYAEGGDLLRHLNTHGAVKESQAKRWFAQLVSALQYLHSSGIAHRDLKCENILLSKKGTIQLADFGFARVCDEENGNFCDTYCGSAAYAAPEVILGQPYNPMVADIWSLGIILFVMLNATMPFDDVNLKKLVADHHNRNYRFDPVAEKQLSLPAKRTIFELLNPDPNERIPLKGLTELKWIDENSAKEKRRRLVDLCGKVKTTASKKTGCRC